MSCCTWIMLSWVWMSLLCTILAHDQVYMEGEPVKKMVFINRGHIESSYKLNNNQTSVCILGPGHFCGDELLSWSLRTPFVERLPPSTATLRSFRFVWGLHTGQPRLALCGRPFPRQIRRQEPAHACEILLTQLAHVGSCEHSISLAKIQVQEENFKPTWGRCCCWSGCNQSSSGRQHEPHRLHVGEP